MEKGEIDFVSKLRDYKRRGNCPIQQKEFELLPDSPQYNALGFDIYKESKTPLRFRNKYTMKMNSSLQGNMDDTLASKMFNASNIRKEALTPLLSMEYKYIYIYIYLTILGQKKNIMKSTQGEMLVICEIL